MVSTKLLLGSALALATAIIVPQCLSQALPTTAGDTLSGKPIVLADAIRGHAAVLVAGFSRAGGSASGSWVKSIHGDPALAGIAVYQIAMIEGAPGFARGMIKNGMKKGVPPAQQDYFVVLTQDEKPWRGYFDVTADQDAYVVLIDAGGKVRWHGHGSPESLEPQLRAALPQAGAKVNPKATQ